MNRIHAIAVGETGESMEGCDGGEVEGDLVPGEEEQSGDGENDHQRGCDGGEDRQRRGRVQRRLIEPV